MQANPEHTLEKLLGYSLNVEPSSIAHAGEGVKLNGKVPIGSVVVRTLTLATTMWDSLWRLTSQY